MFNCDTQYKYTNKAIAPVAAINTSNTFILSVAVNTMVIKAKILEANTPTYGALVFLPQNLERAVHHHGETKEQHAARGVQG